MVRGAVAVVLAGGLLTAAAFAGARWFTAGQPVAITPPAGATEQLPEGGYESSVDNETSDVHAQLESGRGWPDVHVYALPADTTWSDVTPVVGGQLEGWKQLGQCGETGRRVTTCRWEEQARWQPRTVRAVLLGPPAINPEAGYEWPDIKILIIGAGRG
ncbi:hypothetical protein ACTI_42110 [Actinoplanes sp. OR16]|nr:hypothetical protein ACTI_42110 [Actinoplanes sp. OR16]